jgi:hypothetical protein
MDCASIFRHDESSVYRARTIALIVYFQYPRELQNHSQTYQVIAVLQNFIALYTFPCPPLLSIKIIILFVFEKCLGIKL